MHLDYTPEIPYGYCQCGCGQKTEICTHTNKKNGRIKGRPNPFVKGHTTLRRLDENRLKERFWSYVDKSGGDDACWIWTAGSIQGYGSVKVNGKDERAHRISYWLEYGDFPDDLFVLHSCDNPSCVNPKHLWLGTKQDNTDDMFAKGRGRKAKGEQSGMAKYTDAQVAEMRRLREEGRTLQFIADIFGSTSTHVGKICRYELRV